MNKDLSKNYLTVQGWMVSELKLKGNDLLVYALIYGFTQDNESKFTGSLNYICNWLNCSRPTASKALNNLVEKGLITKIVTIKNNVTFNSYVNSLHVIKKLYGGSKETLQGGSKETLHNTNNFNINNNKHICGVETPPIDYDKFIDYFNSFANRSFRINDKLINTLNKRLKTYSKQQLQDAIKNAHNDDYHITTNFKYLTPELILREDKLERFVNNPKPQNNINHKASSN
jgi:hypothetical protein